ncbi:MAG: hypothetical protein FJX76_07945 [Armatimonadetes bacterium]|nr:hypothetical protein [Armatimonadota bacterium]
MRGSILFNGNAIAEGDLIRTARDLLLDSRHGDLTVRSRRKVLLVTAGWEEREYEEAHVKQALYEIGIPGQDDNVQNLSAWHTYQEFCAREPAVAALWHTREQLIEATRALYLEKNGFFTAYLRRSLESLKRHATETTMPGSGGAEGHSRWIRSVAEVMANVRAFTHPPADFDGARLLSYFLGRDIRDTLAHLVANDDRMVELLHDLDEHFADGTGLHHNATWRRLRDQMERRILSANAIMLFGGHLGVLHRALNFFRLRETFAEALRRGTCFYASSAGALILCERIIVYNDFPSDMGPRREFQLFDRGFGLVRHLQVFPHCMDRIQTDDSDNLAYLAHRFQNRVCVGLNEGSFLLIESNPALRCTSLGREDGVYVFDPSGRKMRYDQGQEIPLA